MVDVFTGEVPLSMRTILKRLPGTTWTPIARRCAIDKELKKGTIRRVKAVEVGSGKYDVPQPPAPPLVDDKKENKEYRKAVERYRKARKFNVFALVKN